MIIECIKNGFKLTHRNWQLIFIRMVVAVINLFGLFIFLGVPVLVAVTYLGFDAAHAKDLLPYLFKNPLEFITRYIGLLFLIVTALFFYLIFSSLLFLYTLSGTVGVLKSSVINGGYRFSLSSFFKEAKKHFLQLFYLLSILIIGITALIVVLIFVGFGISQFGHVADTSLRVFLNSFITLSSIVFGSIFFLAAFAFVVYSVTVSVIEEKRAIDSIKRTFEFLKDNPAAFLFYLILLIGLIVANFILIPFSIIPVILPLINIVLQNYLSVVVWSSLVIFYTKSTSYPISTLTYDI